VGPTDGLSVGANEGPNVGLIVGASDGDSVGLNVGPTDGLSVGVVVGPTVGAIVGDFDGLRVGLSVGASVVCEVVTVLVTVVVCDVVGVVMAQLVSRIPRSYSEMALLSAAIEVWQSAKTSDSRKRPTSQLKSELGLFGGPSISDMIQFIPLTDPVQCEGSLKK